MIKLEAIEKFKLQRFDELKNLERVGLDTTGQLNVGDKFECTKELADYLLGDNPLKKAVVKVIEVIPEEEKEEVIEEPKEEIKKPKKAKKSTK